MRKKCRYLLLVLFMLFSILPVRADGNAKITGPEFIWLRPGETVEIKLETEDFDDGNTVSYRLLNDLSESVTLNDNGTLTGNTVGGNELEATLDNGFQYTVHIIVAADPEAVEFISPEIVDDKIILNLNDSDFEPVFARGLPQEASNCRLTYYSENPGIAKVEQNTVYPVAEGTTRIVAEADNGVKGYLNAEVRKGHYADYIGAENHNIVLDTGEEVIPEYYLTPYGGDFSDEIITWSLEQNNNNAVSLDAKTGKITGLAYGNATVRAAITNGSYVDYYVNVEPVLQKIEFDESKSYTLTDETFDREGIPLSRSMTEYLILTPSSASDRPLKYESSDPNVILFSDVNRPAFEIKGTGTTTVTVTSADNPDVKASHDFEIIASTDPDTIEPVTDTDVSFYAGYVYSDPLVAVKYSPENAKIATDWTSTDWTVLRNMTYTQNPYLYNQGDEKPGTAVVTASSKTVPELSVDFNVTSIDGDPPKGTFTQIFNIYNADDPNTPIASNPSKITLEKGKTYIFEMQAVSDICVPSNFYLLRKIDGIDILKYKNQGGSGIDGRDPIQLSCSIEVEAEKAGTAKFNLGKEYKLTITVKEEAAPKKGTWKKDGTGWWYDYGDGTYPKSEFKNIDGVDYYFNDIGYMVTGWQQINGNWYFFEDSGAMKKNAWEGDYWLQEDGIMATSRWVDNDKYYVGPDGKWIENYGKPRWIKDGTGWWYDNGDGTYPKSEIKTIDSKDYYFNDAGYMVTGWQQINGDWYYFDESGAMMKNAWIDNHKYYVGPDGKWIEDYSKPHWVKDEKGWWYDNGDGTYPRSTFRTIDGIDYYFKMDGYMAIGWQQINGSWYFFEDSGAMKKNAWEGDYWLKEDGVMAYSSWVDNGKYYVGPDGRWIEDYGKPRWIKDDIGWWYDNADGTYPKSEFRNIDGVDYYFNDAGYMVTGWQQINGSWYFFEDSGAMKKNAWEGDYWLKEDGVMATSSWVDNGKYYVGPDGKWIEDYGKPKWIKDDIGWWYDYGDGTYPKSEFRNIDGVDYYFNDAGYMVTGWQQINGSWYFFEDSGAMKKNAWEGNYWLKEDGIMATNAWVDNDRYYVDENGAWVPDAKK